MCVFTVYYNLQYYYQQRFMYTLLTVEIRCIDLF